MSIVKLDKITLYGSLGQRAEVLVLLQRLGCLHLIGLRRDVDVKSWQHPHRSDVHEALKYLHASPLQNAKQHAHYPDASDCLSVSREVLEIKSRRQDLKEEADELERSIALLEPWGDFRVPEPAAVGGLRLWFYPIRHHRLAELQSSGLVWHAVAEDNQFAYVVVVGECEPQGVPGNRVELDVRPLSQLRSRLDQVNEERESLQQRRFALTRFTTLLARDLNEADDETERMDAVQQLVADDRVFALQAWVPHSALEAVRDFARQHRLALIVETPAADDRPPTLLKNPQAAVGAEGAVTFYITPDYRAWDPTWIMFGSFALFFAMIMADAGYGLVLALALLLLWRKLSDTPSKIGFRNLLLALVAATIAYGMLIGSYFGLSPPEGSLLDRLVWKSGPSGSIANDRDAMMLLTVAIGALHIALANLIVAWQNRHSSRAFGALGWVLAMIAGLSLGVAMGDEPSAIVRWLAARMAVSAEAVQSGLQGFGEYGLILALAAVFLFSSSRPLFSSKPKDWLLRLFDGLQGLTGISKAFGDVLSYLRLFALGLASAQLAITFNDLARGASEVPGLGFLLAILILVVGHSLNLVLGIVGGVVHGLRLNCIEFFSWCLTEEGYPFRAFSKKAGC